MGATNHTTNYNLSQFVGTDKPAWLQDYNGDMTKIDAGIHQAKQAADTAQLDATQACNAAAANASAITSLQTNVGALQTQVGTNTGNINTINSLIGNGTPTTTDHTIIGAINEINAKVKELHNGIDHPLTGGNEYSDISLDYDQYILLAAYMDNRVITPFISEYGGVKHWGISAPDTTLATTDDIIIIYVNR